MKKVEIFTDGGCSPNPGPGAWAALLRCAGKEREISGHVTETTNNRMELSAALEALRALSQSCEVVLYTDSQYLKNGMTQWLAGWKKRGWRTAAGKAVLNQDLWEALALEASRHTIVWQWVRGHCGHAENERVDALVKARREQG